MTRAQRLRDTESPQYKAMQTALSESYKATTVEERNRLVDQAKQSADDALAFYQEHGDEMLDAKETSAKVTAAVADYKALPTVADKRQWLSADPQRAALVRAEPQLIRLGARITELRKVLENPTVSDSTKAVANRDITRIYGIIAGLVK